MFATMRRKNRSAKMKNELGQSVDHFRRAASIAAQETSATVGPKINAARDRVQPAATIAKDAATYSWDSALAALTPLVEAATDNARQAGKAGKRVAKNNKKNAKKFEKRAGKALGRKQKSRTGAKLAGLLLAGAAIGAAGAYVIRKRRTEQWDEYDPSSPIGTPVGGADDAAFEPADLSGPSGLVPPVDEAGPIATDEVVDQTSSKQHSPKVARMASGQNKN